MGAQKIEGSLLTLNYYKRGSTSTRWDFIMVREVEKWKNARHIQEIANDHGC